MSDSEIKDKGKKSQQMDEQDQQKIIEGKKKAQAAVKKRASKGGFISDYQYHIVIGGFILLCAVALGSVFLGDNRKLSQIPVVEDLLIEKQNAMEGKKYTIGSNEFFKDWKLSEAKNIISNQLSNKPSIFKCATESDTSIIPASYNFYNTYPDCKRDVFVQGNCSSAYTIAAVSSISDRYCQHTYHQTKKIQVNLSPQTVISCDSARNYQCGGGAVTTVFDYAKRDGLVDLDCLNYDPLDEKIGEVPCPTSLTECERYFIVDYCLTTDVEGIKKEIYKNGPMVAMMTVHRDFLIYKDGIFDPEEGTSKFRSGQAVKIYGWGIEEIDGQNIDYWLIENSWGNTWGEDGHAKVKLRIADNFLDQFAVGAMPKVEKEQVPETETTTTGEKGEDEKPETTDLDSEEEQL